MKMKVYEYPLVDKLENGDEVKYNGSYTIKEDVKPLGFKGEVLVDTFEL